jgi:ribosomal protein S5
MFEIWNGNGYSSGRIKDVSEAIAKAVLEDAKKNLKFLWMGYQYHTSRKVNLVVLVYSLIPASHMVQKFIAG